MVCPSYSVRGYDDAYISVGVFGGEAIRTGSNEIHA